MATGNVVQAAPGRVGGFEVPMAVAENAGVCPGTDHFTYKQVVGCLVVRFGDQFAGQPCRTPGYERLVMPFNRKQFNTAVAEFVRVGVEAQTADFAGEFNLCHGRHLNHEQAAVLHQFAGFYALVQHHGELGRGKVQRTGPGGRHDVLHASMARRHQNGRPVVDQSIGFVQRDGGNVLVHSCS